MPTYESEIGDRNGGGEQQFRQRVALGVGETSRPILVNGKRTSVTVRPTGGTARCEFTTQLHSRINKVDGTGANWEVWADGAIADGVSKTAWFQGPVTAVRFVAITGTGECHVVD